MRDEAFRWTCRGVMTGWSGAGEERPVPARRAWLWLTVIACLLSLGTSASVYAAQDGPPGLCRAERLYVSDNPESVRATRGLLYAPLGEATCVRLLYHHENVNPSAPLALRVWAYDSDRVPAEADVTLGQGGPDRDPMRAGHLAMVRFWQAVLAGSSVHLSIAAHQWKPLVAEVLAPYDVVSGLVQVEVRRGHLTLAVLAYLPGASESDISPASFFERQDTHPFGVFVAPRIERHLEAEMDRPRGMLIAGSDFLRSERTGDLLKGNYGVIYHLRIECLNPYSRPVLLTLGFTPLHGPAAATLVVGHRLVEVPPLPQGVHRDVVRFQVSPGRWPLDIWMSPEGGSAYPVRLEFLPALPVGSGQAGAPVSLPRSH
jgi:hypothetical protein